MELSVQNKYSGTWVQKHYLGTRLMLLSPLEKSGNLTWFENWSP